MKVDPEHPHERIPACERPDPPHEPPVAVRWALIAGSAAMIAWALVDVWRTLDP